MELDESEPFLHAREPKTAERKPRAATVSWHWQTAVHVILSICVATTLANAYYLYTLLSHPSVQSADIYGSYPLASGQSLPRPNQFIGLESVNRSKPGFVPPKPIVNMPRVLTQVDSVRPEFVYTQDPRRWLSFAGAVTPDDKNFLVNRTVHTIAQFRVLDFGMERCQLMFNISLPSHLAAEDNPLVPFSRAFQSSASSPSFSVSIAVSRLAVDRVLDIRTLSWKTRPAKANVVGSYAVAEGSATYTGLFDCPSDSLQTFEFACDGEDSPGNECMLSWWQDLHQTLGVFLVQHPSV